MNEQQTLVLQAERLNKVFQGPPNESLQILQDIDLQVQAGDQIAIVGASGSGKTTLLHLLAGIDSPTTGAVRLLGQPLHALDERALCQLRNQQMGFVFQFHHLLPEFSVLDNVLMPLRIGGNISAQQRDFAQQLLRDVGLAQRMRHVPAQLSGGERQRVAIARALVNQPAVVFLDEPTGNLDSATSKQIETLLLTISQTHRTAFVIVTHNQAWAAAIDRTYHLHQGRLTA